MTQENLSGASGQKKEANLTNFRVLIVDDFTFMAELLAGLLKEAGIGNTLTCESAEEAQQRITHAAQHQSASSHIDLALIDWLMPGTNGVELIKWIRGHKQEHIKFMPLVLISAYTSRKVVQAARDNGANEALVKPIAAETLISRLIHVINHQRPFVKTGTFFGPDRRRQDQPFQGEEKRKTDPNFVKVHKEDV